MTDSAVPTMMKAQKVTEAWTMLPAWLPVGALGVLPVNSFLLKGAEPVLVDTGLAMLGEGFMKVLEGEIDPLELRWIWLSHMDPDHIGNLGRVLERAPRARVVTDFLGMGKMNLMGLPVDRVHVLQPGAVLTAGAHRLTALRPPYFDAPETIGFFDERERVLFAADSFGALFPAPVDALEEVSDSAFCEGLFAWSAIDAPWLSLVDSGRMGRALATLDRTQPEWTLSGHLPLTRKGISPLTRAVAETCRRLAEQPGEARAGQAAAA